ncbi:hypothetical protein [Blastococcus sp. URHD0036]|uniref:hypothetical protein n=1 Tax=Blastococcus sp. URHD0036 TaxID=1380356 RepID=UPI0012DED6CE|nr:hypothetical protein [Blastococcus sp. URHD0036]
MAKYGVEETKQLPYRNVQLSPTLRGEIHSVTADLFPGDILVLGVRARLRLPAAVSLRQTFTSVQSLRSAKTIPPVDTLFREMAMLARGVKDGGRDSCRYESFFALSLGLPLEPLELERQTENLNPDLVAALIGSPSAELLRPELVERVLSQSEDLNSKAVGEKLLINRQGIAYVRPRGLYSGPHANRYARTRDLAKLALYARAFLRDDSGFSQSDGAFAEFIASRLQQWIEYPMLVFENSVSHTHTWERLIESFLLADRLQAWSALRTAEGSDEMHAYARQQPDWWLK